MTTNGTSATVYVDGASLGTQTFPTTLDTLPAPQGFRSAPTSRAAAAYFSGDLADVAVFPAALTAAQVAAQYAASGGARGEAPHPQRSTASYRPRSPPIKPPERAALHRREARPIPSSQHCLSRATGGRS